MEIYEIWIRFGIFGPYPRQLSAICTLLYQVINTYGYMELGFGARTCNWGNKYIVSVLTATLWSMMLYWSSPCCRSEDSDSFPLPFELWCCIGVLLVVGQKTVNHFITTILFSKLYLHG